MTRVNVAHSSPSFYGMIADSAPMKAVFQQIERVAPYESAVLIRGETGTGKELVARALHHLSSRSEGPFCAINCATLTPELLASTLFGHVRGAFTGAINDRKGLFLLANHGTLFLDEIAELPLDLQARLLRVIQEQEFTPVGGTESVRVNVRILSATHRALRNEVKQKRFREDLMYRLRVIPLYLPPLREREGDLFLITTAILKDFNETQVNKVRSRQVNGFSRDAELALISYSWPGNIRELMNVIEYAMIMGDGDTITLDHLPPELRGIPPLDQPSDEIETQKISEHRLIKNTLMITKGHRGETAKILDMSRATLWRKMKQYGLLT